MADEALTEITFIARLADELYRRGMGSFGNLLLFQWAYVACQGDTSLDRVQLTPIFNVALIPEASGSYQEQYAFWRKNKRLLAEASQHAQSLSKNAQSDSQVAPVPPWVLALFSFLMRQCRAKVPALEEFLVAVLSGPDPDQPADIKSTWRKQLHDQLVTLCDGTMVQGGPEVTMSEVRAPNDMMTVLASLISVWNAECSLGKAKATTPQFDWDWKKDRFPDWRQSLPRPCPRSS